YLFGQLNATLFVAIWVFGPLLTADSISGEKRDGTLGLLFLTPLKPIEIVLAKLATHGLRATTLLLAAMPVLMIAVLNGGVSWADGLRVVMLDVGAVLLALTAGLLASSICREWVRAMILAMCLSCASGIVFVLLQGSTRAVQVFLKAG